MGRTIEISGHSMVYFFYASSLGIVPVIVYFWVMPLDGWRSVLGVAVSVGLVLIAGADLWWWKHNKEREHLPTAAKRNLPYDITYRPSLQPEHPVRHELRKTVSREDDDD